MRLFLTFCFLATLYLQYQLWLGNGALPKWWQLQDDVAIKKLDNLAAFDRNEALLAEVLDLKQGQEAIEERARLELGLIREGEIFFRFVE
jgi:cell division protein FtsB